MHPKKFLQNLIARKYDFHVTRVLRDIERSKMAALRAMDNVSLADDFNTGIGCVISVLGDARFEAEKEVVLGNYCSMMVRPGASLRISGNVFFNNYCSINSLGSITIGQNTIFGEGVKIYDHNHKHQIVNATLDVERDEFSIGPVSIGRNCWIGSNVTILKGAIIGDNVIIGANCLIYQSIPPNSVVKSRTDLIIDSI